MTLEVDWVRSWAGPPAPSAPASALSAELRSSPDPLPACHLPSEGHCERAGREAGASWPLLHECSAHKVAD